LSVATSWVAAARLIKSEQLLSQIEKLSLPVCSRPSLSYGVADVSAWTPAPGANAKSIFPFFPIHSRIRPFLPLAGQATRRVMIRL